MFDTTQAFNDFVQTQLNQEQQHAVVAKDGVFLVCAGAGSGKTRVITARIAHLILNHAVDPGAIVALTFTNKAAHEMKERVRNFLPAGSAVPYVGTFHSYCLRLLKIYGHLIQKTDFTVLDSDDQESLIKNIIKRHNITKKITARTVIGAISHTKNNAVHYQDASVGHIQDPLLQQLYLLYEQEKQASHALDFDDLLLLTLKLFQTQPIFKQQFQTRTQHILVDEYQDTNKVQHAILKEMALNPEGFSGTSLCIVGDEDQSIYSWRGATVSNIVNFKHDFPTARTITLEQNYRSVQQILDVANHVIQYNTERNPKNLWSNQTGNDRVRLLTCASSYQEGAMIASYGKHLKRTKNLNKLAVLYRSHYQSRALEEALLHQSVPYKIIGGTQFYDRQEVKDILAYLRLVNNPFDRIAFMRAISTPSRGLGEKFVEQFFEVWDQQPFLDVRGIVQQFLTQNLVTGIKKESLLEFDKVLGAVQKTDTASFISEHIIKSVQYITYLKDAWEAEEAKSRIENVKELITAMKASEERGSKTLSDFLDEVALLQEHIKKSEDDQDFVRLMTLHSAKGLEFDTVILTGLEEGVLPSSHSVFNPETLEEERRLLYVGITRARERLLMTASKYRVMYGQAQDQRHSRFVAELPKNFIKQHDASSWNTEQGNMYVQEWLAGRSSIASPFDSAQDERNKHTSSQSMERASKPTLNITLPTKSKLANGSVWKKNQPVKHATFGIGIIEQVEEVTGQSPRLTIRFSAGTKKSSANFISSV
jgi:DNA helicase-2/ATP-dependent DNA helicase PcrA